MKISICIDALYAGKDIPESLQAIHRLGIQAFEFWGWWDKDLQAIKKTKEQLGLEVSAFCTKFISLVDASKQGEYIDGLQESIAAAKMLNCKRLISQVGDDLGIDRVEQHKNMLAGLKACVPILEKEDITLVIEPLNTTIDHAGYYLYRSEEAFQIIEEVGSEHVKVLYDIYHQQIMEGNLINTISRNITKIGHFHAAGLPGRHELYLGEINYPHIFRAIDSLGYAGFVGFEYFPIEAPDAGIKAFL